MPWTGDMGHIYIRKVDDTPEDGVLPDIDEIEPGIFDWQVIIGLTNRDWQKRWRVWVYDTTFVVCEGEGGKLMSMTLAGVRKERDKKPNVYYESHVLWIYRDIQKEVKPDDLRGKKLVLAKAVGEKV